MPYPNTTASVIVISQTSGSAIGGQYPFIERQISGSNLFLVTDASGNLTGSTSIPGGSFTNLNVTGALTASVISASTAITSAAIISGPITASNISASGYVSASNLYVLTTVGIGSNLTVGTNLTVGGDSNLGNALTDTITISGSITQTGSFTTQGSITANGNINTNANISASGNISASVFVGAHTGSTFGTASWANNALTASNLVPTNNYTVANFTASNISASGTISSSNLYVLTTVGIGSNLTVGTNLTVGGNTTLGNALSDVVVITGSIAQTGSSAVFSAVTASSISSSGVVSASVLVGPHTGSTFGTSSWANNALTSSNLVSGNSYQITNLTANGNISASSNISASTGWFNNLTVAGTLTATVSGSISVANSSSVSNNNTSTLQYITFVDGTGNRPTYIDQDGLTYVPSSNTLSSSGIISASVFVGAHTGSTFGTSSWANNSLTSSNVVVANVESSANRHYLTFVADTNSGQQIYTDSSSLSWFPTANRLQLGASGELQIGSGNSLISMQTDPTVATVSIGTTGTGSLTVGGNTTFKVTAPTNLLEVGATGSFTNTVQATSWNNGAVVVAGGVGIGKNLVVSGSTTLYGDLTLYGTGSIVNISSSTIIIGDNRIALNAWSAGGPQRYGGLDIFDSGSSAAVTSSILWDSLNNYWLLQTNATGSPVTTSSAIILQGPTSSFGSEYLLTVNNFLKVQTTNGNLITSSLSEVGNTLQYAGTISSSILSGSNIFVGATITAATGSFTNLTVVTGSSPGVGTQVPATPTAAGLPGQIEVDNNFIYVYTNNIWKRVPVSVWSN